MNKTPERIYGWMESQLSIARMRAAIEEDTENANECSASKDARR